MKKIKKESIQFYAPVAVKQKAVKKAHKKYMSLTQYLIQLIEADK